MTSPSPPWRKDVVVHSETAHAFFQPGALAGIFDPERPHMDPNELLAEMGGMLDPVLMNFDCPFCHRTMRWKLFEAHMFDDPKKGIVGCMRRWWNTMDITNHIYAGASIGG